MDSKGIAYVDGPKLLQAWTKFELPHAVRYIFYG